MSDSTVPGAAPTDEIPSAVRNRGEAARQHPATYSGTYGAHDVIWLSDDEITADSVIPVNQGDTQDAAQPAVENSERYAEIDRRLEAIRDIDPLKELVTELEDRSLGINPSSSVVRSDGTVDQRFVNIVNVLAETAAKLDPLEESRDEAVRRNGGPISLWLQADCDREIHCLAKRLRLLQMALNMTGGSAEAAAEKYGTSSCSKRPSNDVKNLEALRASISCFEEEILKITDEEMKRVFQEKLEEARTEALQIKVDHLRLKLRKEVLKPLAPREHAKDQVQKHIELPKSRSHQATRVEERPADPEPQREHIKMTEEPVIKNSSGPTSNGRQRKRQNKSKLQQGENPISAKVSKFIDLRIQAVKDLEGLKQHTATIQGLAKKNWRKAFDKCQKKRGGIMKKVKGTNKAEQWRETAERRLGRKICTWTTEEFEAERKANVTEVSYLRSVLSGSRNLAESSGEAVEALPEARHAGPEPRQENIEVVEEHVMRNSSGPALNGRHSVSQKKSELQQGKNPITVEVSQAINLRIRAVKDFEGLNRHITTIQGHAKENWRHVLQECNKERGRIMRMVKESNNILDKPEKWRGEAQRRFGKKICTWTTQEFEAKRKASYQYLRDILSGEKNPVEAPKPPKQREAKTEALAMIRRSFSIKKLDERNPAESSVEAPPEARPAAPEPCQENIELVEEPQINQPTQVREWSSLEERLEWLRKELLKDQAARVLPSQREPTGSSAKAASEALKRTSTSVLEIPLKRSRPALAMSPFTRELDVDSILGRPKKSAPVLPNRRI